MSEKVIKISKAGCISGASVFVDVAALEWILQLVAAFGGELVRRSEGWVWAWVECGRGVRVLLRFNSSSSEEAFKMTRLLLEDELLLLLLLLLRCLLLIYSWPTCCASWR